MSKSSKRTQAVDTTVQKRFLQIAPTEWNFDGGLVKTVCQYRQSLIELFESIVEHKDVWDSETVNSSRGYLVLLRDDFDFNFLLKIFSEVLSCTDTLCDVLQTESNNIDFCVQKIDEFEIQIKKLTFEGVWQKTNQLEGNMEPSRKRMRIEEVGNTQTSYRRLFIQILDNISRQLNDRFKNLRDLKFVQLCNFDKYRGILFPEDAFVSLEKHYANFFDVTALYCQLSALYHQHSEIANDRLKMLKFLKETGLEEAFSEVSKLCELVLTMPATSVERTCFSALKRVKNFVRNCTGEERLANLAILSVENELIKDLSQESNFYDTVIDEFVKNDRWIELRYK